MTDLKLSVPAIIRRLINLSYNPVTRSDCSDALSRYMGWRIDSHRVNALTRQDDISFDTAVKALSFFGYKMGVVLKGEFYEFTALSEVQVLASNLLQADDRNMPWLAEKMGVCYDSVRQWFKRSNSRVDKIRKIFAVFGYELIIRNDSGNSFIVGSTSYLSYKLAEYIGDCVIPMSEETGYASEFAEGVAAFARVYIEKKTTGKLRKDKLYSVYLQFCEKSSYPALKEKPFDGWVNNTYMAGRQYVYGIALRDVS